MNSVKVRDMTKKRISVVGTGYVGLSTAVGFAKKGYNVTTSSHNQEKVTMVNGGIAPFYEPGLSEALKQAVDKGDLKAVLGREQSILDTDVTFLAVGTPSRSDGSIELKYIESAAHEIGKALGKKDSYHLIVVKSTVVPGTTEKVVKPALESGSKKRCGVDFGLCMSPEFLRQGYALFDTFNPDRIVIGENDEKSGDELEALYREFYGEKTVPLIRATLSTAELIKYGSNACLATKISYINTIANICEMVPGADVTVVGKAIGLDKRIGPLFLRAGLGYGGSCFPKDVKALIAFSREVGYEPTLLDDVEKINKEQPLKAVEYCRKLVGDLRGKRVAVLGLSFKPLTDDMREAKSIPIIKQLLKEGANVSAYDPVAVANAKVILKDTIEYAPSTVDCLKNSDCCILVTEWEEFKKLQPEDFAKHMKQSALVDGRRIYDPKQFSQKMKFAAIGFGQ
jgi:UDPglucose 6-dehydrogenase